MATGFDFGALRGEIAKRHKLMLDETDPIFVSVTLNELVMEHYLKLATEAAQAVEERSVARMTQDLDAVKEESQKIILGATAFFREEVGRMGVATVANVGKVMDQRLESGRSVADKAARAATFAAIAAGLALLSSLINVGLFFAGRH